MPIYKITWPDGRTSIVKQGQGWLEAAKEAEVSIPTGCLTGSCGACEIEVNGKVIRACTSAIDDFDNKELKVSFFYDPFW